MGLVDELMKRIGGLGMAVPQQNAHVQDFQQNRHQQARNIAAYISSLIESPNIGGPMDAGQYRAHPAWRSAPEQLLPDGGVRGQIYERGRYSPENLGTVGEYDYFGGLRLPTPPSAGIGLVPDGPYYSEGLGHMTEHSDPFRQEVYGNLVLLGHPVLGPSYESVYGEPGLIGFGRRQGGTPETPHAARGAGPP
jgi:hypothetical protein